MQPTFDPVRKRKFWLDFNLAYEMRFEPDEIPAKGQPLYLSTMTNSLITAYLLGLGDRVRPAAGGYGRVDGEAGPNRPSACSTTTGIIGATAGTPATSWCRTLGSLPSGSAASTAREKRLYRSAPGGMARLGSRPAQKMRRGISTCGGRPCPEHLSMALAAQSTLAAVLPFRSLRA